MTDAFGDNGIVAAAIVDTAGELPEITDLVMSCRVMGRNIEDAVIDRIEEQMQEEGYTGLRGRYIPTAKISRWRLCMKRDWVTGRKVHRRAVPAMRSHWQRDRRGPTG